ncbi:DUF1269 domain-containing protein [Candidatus Solirubrobacter pratensis]|uniref:DUF1269 domain-containing protein n=1 Tax=Candidatus Solirubrobacter pratensis TaxID=1298857 RepID=UPI000406809C|nr:DUF1269 domain-containing protein [Candidatus Solirubrobacter pratensis]
MYTLTVWRSPAPQDAEAHVLPRLEQLVGDGVAVVEDAALVSWPAGRRKPSTRELGSLSGPGSLWGGFWGVLLALVFLTPIAGPAFGAAAGAIAGSLSDFGVEDDFVMRVREQVTPGSSAVFVLATATAAERLAAELDGLAITTVRSELSDEQEHRLRDVLAEESSRS